MPDLAVQLVTGARHTVSLPDESYTVAELRRLAAKALQLPLQRLRLVHKGQPLQDGAQLPAIAGSDVILAFTAPLLPSAQLNRSGARQEADEEAEERFRLRPNATRAERWLAASLQHRLHAPDWLLQALFSTILRPGVAACTVLWFAAAPLAARFSLGPLYVLGTILAVILTNLGKRREGELSAYSIFNPGVQQLPGQLNADAIDQQIRAGQI